MPTEAQSASVQTDVAQFDAALREPPAPSAEEREKLRKSRVEQLIRLTGKIGAYAASQGMTDEIFEQLLSEDRHTA